jgi:23S rRNA (cytosine1962-C5)-methyltransferase
LPETGKPHQIRLHAESCGIPILGDKDHGGSAFPTLCLHSAELRFVLDGEEISHATPPPIWFESRELVTDRTLIRWLAAVDRRARLLRSGAIAGASFSAAAGIAPPIPATDLTLRWIHSEGDPLRAEQLGPVHWLSWYSDTEPSPTDLDRVRRLTETLGWRQWVLQLRGNRGRAPNEERRYLGPEPVPERWQGTELSRVRYEFRADQGLSPGLFLDQRRNRAWVLHNAQGLRVLNLFCYTGGFSVCAALGGAERVVSVDVSKPFLEWSKTNFVCNGLCTEGHEFRAMDSRDYLEWARKKNITFDLVICDPPSFGRSKSGVFTMEKDFARLFEMLLDVTAPQGRILFSSNYERWSLEDFAARAQALARGKNIRLRLEATPSPDWDFELPRAPRNMKSFFAVRI